MKCIFYILVTIVFFATSCQKELFFDKAPAIIDTILTTPIADTSWQPGAKNSYWKYKSDNATADVTVLTNTGNTQDVNGKLFYIFEATKNGIVTNNALFAKQNMQYELRNVFTHFELVQPRVYSNIVYLINDTAKTGDTWEYDAGMASNNLPSKISGEVVAKGFSTIVNGKNYNNVLLTKVNIWYQIHAQGGYENYQSYYFYLVRGVGIIKARSVSTGGASNTFNISDELVEYKIY